MMYTKYFDEIPASVTVCDVDGKILFMNERSAATFAKDGGKSLIGKDLYECHPGTSKEKLRALMESHQTNSYTIEKNGVKKMIYQTPWFENGEFRGLIEFSFVIPADMPHFMRG